MQDKVYQLESDVKDIRNEQVRANDTLKGIEKAMERMADIFGKLTIVSHEVDTVKLDMEHKFEILEGKLRGNRDLDIIEHKDVKSDIEELTKGIYAINSMMQRLLWGAAPSVLAGFVYLLAKQIGVL